MMVKIGHTLKDIFTFFVLLVIIVFVYALLGVELFSYDLKLDSHDKVCPKEVPISPRSLSRENHEDCKSPRLNFDNF